MIFISVICLLIYISQIDSDLKCLFPFCLYWDWEKKILYSFNMPWNKLLIYVPSKVKGQIHFQVTMLSIKRIEKSVLEDEISTEHVSQIFPGRDFPMLSFYTFFFFLLAQFFWFLSFHSCNLLLCTSLPYPSRMSDISRIQHSRCNLFFNTNLKFLMQFNNLHNSIVSII